jgi:hypothetical protein
MADSKQYSLDIVTATWGSLDVTNILRKLYAESAKTNNVFTFTPGDHLFGHDPNLSGFEWLIVVWRVMLDTGHFSEFKVHGSIQRRQSAIFYDGSKLRPAPDLPRNPEKVVIIAAFWWNQEVTPQAQALADKTPPSTSISITAEDLLKAGVKDPKPGILKQIVVTFAYVSADGEPRIFVKGGTDQVPVVFRQAPSPPQLTIWGATYGGTECTKEVTSMIDPASQTIDADFSKTLKDPWAGVRKTLVVLYQFDGYPLQVYIGTTPDNTQILITPGSPYELERSRYFNNEDRKAGETNIVAMVWGTSPVSQASFKNVERLGAFTPSNEWFGFDGWPYVNKSATIFYQHGLTGDIKCVTAREDNNIKVNLDDRRPLYRDPLAARGFLSFSNPDQDGFTLQVPLGNCNQEKKWLSLSYTNNHTVLSFTGQKEYAAIFSFLPAKRESGSSKVPVLAVRAPTHPSYSLYIRAVPGSVDTSGTYFEVTSDPKQATEAHYEFPAARQKNLSLLISFNPGGGSAYLPLLLRYIPSTAERGESITAFPMTQSASWIPGDKVKFEQCIFWLDLVTTKVPNPDPNLVRRSGDIIFKGDACLWGIASLLYNAGFRAPNLLFGWNFGLPKLAKEVVIYWMESLGEKLPIFLDIMNKIRALSDGSGTSILGLCFELAKDLYNSGLLWGFYRAIFDSYLVSVLDWGSLILSWVAWAVAQPALGFATFAIKGAEFIEIMWSIISDIEATQNSCNLSGSSSARQKVARLDAAMAEVLPEIRASGLDVSGQMAVMTALRAPHITPLLNDPTAEVPGEAGGLDAQGRKNKRALPLLTDDETLNSYLEITARLDESVLEVVDRLAPKVDALMADENLLRGDNDEPPSDEDRLALEVDGLILNGDRSTEE